MAAAASYGRIEVIQLLLDHGADINIRDNDGDTPLYVVETIQLAQYLLERGALLDTVNEEGISVLATCARTTSDLTLMFSSQ
jgi:uncharacterized protein